MSKTILDRAKEISPQLTDWRRTLHQHPELSFTEEKTAAFVTERLKGLGLTPQTGVAKTGVVAHIAGGDGPVVGLRADMDALPILEENNTDFDSTTPGVMHACGHDAHTAILLGAATILKDLADEGKLPGTIRLLFQPSEEAQDDEGKSGGSRMVEEGALEGVDAVFGLHVATMIHTGMMGTRTGALLAAADRFKITIRGRGGHAAYPQNTLDPIAISAHVIQAIHQIISRNMVPTEAGVITIGQIQAGTADNIIPDTLSMSGTIRSLSEPVRTLLHDQLDKACRIVEALGAEVEVEHFYGYPITVNDANATEIATQAAAGFLGDDNVLTVPPAMGGEDFSYMAQAAPGCFLFLGVKDPEWDREYPVHTSTFRLDERALPIGSTALVSSALNWLSQD